MDTIDLSGFNHSEVVVDPRTSKRGSSDIDCKGYELRISCNLSEPAITFESFQKPAGRVEEIMQSQ